jgi:mannonate dehydratase
MTALVKEEGRRRAAGEADWLIPVRPDHGRLFECDRDRGSYPGYSFVGRVMGLAELRGLETGIRSALGLEYQGKRG